MHQHLYYGLSVRFIPPALSTGLGLASSLGGTRDFGREGGS
jgi:hypothetical protein